MKILAGILHLGNIKYTHKFKENTEEIDHEGCDILVSFNLLFKS